MGQQSNGIGLRYGVIDGWNSSWSINPCEKIEYRDLVQVSSDVEKLVTNLFKLNKGFIGKVGISKSGQTNKIIINVFGYVPSKFKFVDNKKDAGDNIYKSSNKDEKIIYPKQQILLKLYRLAEVLSMKYDYLGLEFAVKCALLEEYQLQPKFKQRRKKGKNKQSLKFKDRNFTPIHFRVNDSKKAHEFLLRRAPSLNSSNIDGYIDYSLIDGHQLESKESLVKQKWYKVKHKRNRRRNFRRNNLPGVLLKSRKKFGFLRRLNYYSTLMNLAYWVFKTKQPQFLAKFLAQEFGKTRFQRSLYNNVDKVCAFLFNEHNDVQGIRIQVSGRMNKSKRTRTFVVQYGAVTTQTVTHPLKYAFEEAYTVYGSMGVKIWISY